MIKIEKPQVVSDLKYATLSAYISVDDKRDEVWFKVDKKFEDYLCHERSDAYVIAVLNYAMRNGHDIVCEAPISEDIYYNIDKYLIDAICQYNKDFHRPRITAPVASDPLPCAGAVATGISCGVDSLHALASQTSLNFKKHNITHLTFNNVGSHGEGEYAQELYNSRLARPTQFAQEYGFELVASNSNLQDVIQQSHYKSHTYSSMFAVFCLQKLYSIYYYASAGYNYSDFTLIDKPNICCGSYEMLSLPLLSTHNLRIYSEGEGMSRLTKLKTVVKYQPSYKYLNVCLKEGDNCNTCEKCIRTLLGLDALGALDNYRDVFDIDYYKTHKKWYLKQLLKYYALRKHDYIEMYPHFKKQIPFFLWIEISPMLFFRAIYRHIPESLKQTAVFQKLRSLRRVFNV